MTNQQYEIWVSKNGMPNGMPQMASLMGKIMIDRG
jgi:hypothetical protein